MTARAMFSPSTGISATRNGNASAFLAALKFWPLAAIALLAVAVQIHWGVNTDTSWNITLAEKVLDGLRPDVDFIEINPPLSFLLYLPPTLAARLTGATPEFMVDLFCFIGAGLSLWLAGAILAAGGLVTRAAGMRLAIIAGVALLLLPARAFDEREHIALIACLPCLAAIAVWAAAGRVAPLLSLVAGLGAALALSIKPHFALFVLPPVVYLGRRAGWRALVTHIEPYVAVAGVALYWGAIAIWCPAFLERAAPIVRDIYLPVRLPLATLWRDPTFIVWIALGALLLCAARRRLNEPLVAVPALASIGAMAAYLIQGKFWPYQGYPVVALLALALGPVVLEGLAELRQARYPIARAALAVGAALSLWLAGFWLSLNFDRSELEQVVAAIGPHPTMLAISPDIGTGHPLARRVHGVWVGSTFGLWITHMTLGALARGAGEATARKYEGYLELDRRMLVDDIVGKRPDAILIAGGPWLAWAQSHADVAAALAPYRLKATADGVMVFMREDAAQPGPALPQDRLPPT